MPASSSDQHLDFMIKSRRVLLADGAPPRPASLRIQNGKISKIGAYEQSFSGSVTDFGDRVIMPGVIDTHVHVNEPGRTEWEGFQTATFAAAVGGITTLIDMPLNSIPATTSLQALEIKRASARGNCSIDYGFWGGVVPGNVRELKPMIEAGVMGFKCFLIDSGVDEFQKVTEADLRLAMPVLAAAGVPLIAHAELEGPCSPGLHAHPRSYGAYLESRPQTWEIEAMRLLIRLSRDTGCAVHIVHLSAAEALTDLARAKAEGVRITAETCPHYLFFTAEEIPEGATHFKCAPPIRERENRERLWAALHEGTLDFIVSDHSPCTPQLKRLEQGDFEGAWGGISGLQFSMPVIWTEMRRRGFPLERLSEWMSARTAAFLGLASKGRIAEGCDADLVVFDPEASFRLESRMVRHKHALTPYEGRTFSGVVKNTFVRGREVVENQRTGEPVRRGMKK